MDTLLYTEIISLLLSYGADIEAKSIHGDTPLHCATSQTNPKKDIISLLISHGADIGAKDVYGKTPRISTADYQALFNGCIFMDESLGKTILVIIVLVNFCLIQFIF
jgi:hypothetical protein